MRKTFVVGKLTVNSTHILLLDGEGSNATLTPTRHPIYTTHPAESKLPEPDTVH